MRISFAGERGSYAEAAAARMFANEDIATSPMRNYRAAFDALANGEVDYTVVPLENSYHGPNTPLFDHLRERRCYITRESRITEVYNLAGQKGAKLADIKRIHAHPTRSHVKIDLHGPEEPARCASKFTGWAKANQRWVMNNL